MEENYFKLRKAWVFRKNKFDLGPPFNIEPIHISGYFVMRIFHLSERDYLPFYKYHRQYYFENNSNGTDKEFLTKVLEFIDKDIKSRETLHYYNTLSKTRIYKLLKFREILKKVDQWELTLTDKERSQKSISYVKEIMNWQSVNDTKSVLSKLLFDEVGSDRFFIEYKRIIEENNELKNLLIKEQKAVEKLQTELKEIAPEKKIEIKNGSQNLLIDLFLQIRDLRNPQTDRNFLSATPELWARLISNYFALSSTKNDTCGQVPISYATARDYFRDKLGKEMLKSKNRGKYFNIKETDRAYT